MIPIGLWRWLVGFGLGTYASGDVKASAALATAGVALSSPTGLKVAKAGALRYGPAIIRSGWSALNLLKVPGTFGFSRAGIFRPGMGVGTAASAVSGGYVLGAAVGTSIAYAGWGEEGAKDAFKFYTGGIITKEPYHVIWEQKGAMVQQVFDRGVDVLKMTQQFPVWSRW